jgi:hypothetical protein
VQRLGRIVKEQVATEYLRYGRSTSSRTHPSTHGCSSAGGFGRFSSSINDWWVTFTEGLDPYLRFLATAFVLAFVPITMDLAQGGWKTVLKVLRLASSDGFGTKLPTVKKQVMSVRTVFLGPINLI